MAETWADKNSAGAGGETFGSIAVLTARGRNFQARVDSALSASVSFLPEDDGSYRVMIAAPHWVGGDVLAAARSFMASKIEFNDHRRWWNALWHRAGLMKLRSKDGSAEYLENLRMIDLFTAAAESGGAIPGSQAGVGDLFSSGDDFHRWDPSAFWHWNLRMQVAANLGAGLFELNRPYFQLYRNNLPSIERWTARRMGGKPGVCVPETMRFNGVGFESEAGAKSPGLNCDAGSEPYYNARTLSTGAEVSWWIWRQYLMTGDRPFLETNYPVMAAAARFLLAYSRTGNDGLRHTSPSNAHENQWDVHDPTTDICAMRTLFPNVTEAGRILGRDPELQKEAQAASGQMLDWPRTDVRTLKRQLTAANDKQGETAIAQSYEQDALIHNSENLGLEPVWPYGLIDEAGPLHELGVRTYESLPNKAQNDWSYDPLDAARLGLADEVKTTLLQLTRKYQRYPSGLASFIGPEFYVEQVGVVAAALEEALVSDHGGLLRIAPAWPEDWDADATVFVEHNSKVHLQMGSGAVAVVEITSGYIGRMRVRSPWTNEAIQVLTEGERREKRVRNSVLELDVERGKSYLLQTAAARLNPLEGTATNRPKFLGDRSIGLGRNH